MKSPRCDLLYKREEEKNKLKNSAAAAAAAAATATYEGQRLISGGHISRNGWLDCNGGIISRAIRSFLKDNCKWHLFIHIYTIYSPDEATFRLTRLNTHLYIHIMREEQINRMILFDRCETTRADCIIEKKNNGIIHQLQGKMEIGRNSG